MKISAIKQKWGRNEFLRNSTKLLSGSIIAQIFPLVAMPFFTRIYSTEEIGVWTAYLTATIILTVIATLQYELAIPLVRKRSEAANLFLLSIIVSMLVSLIMLIFIYLFFDFIFEHLSQKHRVIGTWIYFLPLSSFLLGLFQSINYWLNREKKFGVISKIKISKSSSTHLVQYLLGVFGFTSTGLIGGMIFGQAFSALYAFKKGFWERMRIFKLLRLKKIVPLAIKYKEMPQFNTVLTLLNTLSNHLPILLLLKYHGFEVTALYGLSLRIISTPLGLVGHSVSQVFYQRAAEKHFKNEDLYSFLKQSYWKLFSFSIVPFALIALLAPIGFELYFGSEWEIAGQYTRVLIPFLFLLFINSSVSSIITILKLQKFFVIYNVFLLIARFLAIYAGYYLYKSAYMSILFFSAVGVLNNIFVMIFCLTAAKKRKMGRNE